VDIHVSAGYSHFWPTGIPASEGYPPLPGVAHPAARAGSSPKSSRRTAHQSPAV